MALSSKSTDTVMRLAGLAALLFHVAATQAQTASWIAPTEGYVYDAASQSIRPVDGFIGSAVLGPAIVGGLDWASVAPNRKSALVRRAGVLLWIPDLSAPRQSQEISQVPLAEQALWASDSSRVVIADGHDVYWFSNFGAKPSLDAKWALGLPGARRINTGSLPWSLLAADASANRVLLARRVGATGQLRVASMAAAPLSIPFSGTPVAAAFLPGGTRAFVADGSNHQIVQFQSLDGIPVSGVFLAFEHPVAMATSGDGSRLFVADSAASVVRIFDSATGALISELAADEVPASLTVFGADRFILNPTAIRAPASQPLLLLDTSVTPKVLFIPRGN